VPVLVGSAQPQLGSLEPVELDEDIRELRCLRRQMEGVAARQQLVARGLEQLRHGVELPAEAPDRRFDEIAGPAERGFAPELGVDRPAALEERARHREVAGHRVEPAEVRRDGGFRREDVDRSGEERVAALDRRRRSRRPW
jgi:hypothetical protein